jgi:hypothetical protein
VPVVITHQFNNKLIDKIIKSPVGGVAKDALRRGYRVQARARRNLSGVTGSGPRRVDTGALRASIKVTLYTNITNMTVRVGSNLRHARWVHDGTGIYGPRRTRITPRRARALVWRAKTGAGSNGRGRWRGYVVVSSTRGMRPNPFLRDALPAFHNKNPG